MTDDVRDNVRFYTDNIRTFVAVAEHQGVGRAARALGLTQPSVSQQIARLEAHIGHRLFRRRTAGVQLTSDGEILLRHAQSMIDINELISRDFGISRQKVKLSLGMSEMFSLTNMHRVLWLLMKQNPELSLRIALGPVETLARAFDAGEFDVMVGALVSRLPEAEAFCSEPLAWIGPRGVAEAVPDPIPLIISIAPSRLREVVLGALAEAGRTWTIAVEVTSVSVAEAAIEAGFGYAAVLRNMPLRGPVHLDERAGLPSLPGLDFSLCRRRGRQDELLAAFCDLLKASSVRA